MITCDGAGASHGLIDRLDELGSRPGYEVIYSVGWELGERERDALILVPEQAWQIALDPAGRPRISRTPQACDQPWCEHPRCWEEQAQVTELTGLLREGPGGDRLAGWPASMRVFARRERPHPGAQLSLFEERDGWRYSLWATNLPTHTRRWRGQNAYLDAAHRVHARVEDCIRTSKDTGLGRFPSQSLAINSAWLTASLLAATLLAWLRLLALDGDLARAEPKTLRYRLLHTPYPPRARRPAPTPENPPHLALGHRPGHRLAAHQRPAPSPLVPSKPVPPTRKPHPPGPVEPPAPGPPAGPLSYPEPKININYTVR